MTVLDYMKDHILYLDGAMGTLLQSAGLRPEEAPEEWNLTHPETIRRIHKAYFDAGSNVVITATFGVNRLKYTPDQMERMISAAMGHARWAAENSSSTVPKFTALDLAPTGRLLRPFGDLDFEEAVDIFAQTVRLGVQYGADLIMIETMNDCYETKAALLAAKENSSLPVFVSNAYGEDGKLMTGASPAAMTAMLEGMGADVIGANCSLGPRQLRGVMEELLRCASVPVLFKPNAGLPSCKDGVTGFDVGAEEFAEEVTDLIRKGVRVAGGCCGTTPEYVKALIEKSRNITPVPITEKCETVVSSYTHAVKFGREPILIGERINPTGKKRFKAALRSGDREYLLNEGIRQQEKGVPVLDVNVGLPELDEAAVLEDAVCDLQAILDLPLQIDTSDTAAMARALRRYNGKALINSVSGRADSMAAVFPLMKKYGGVAVALTLDEDGIPDTAEGRVAIAKKILRTAKEYGISTKDFLFDPLTMAISAAPDAAGVTLEAVEIIERELGCRTSLGISNVSFGLPRRGAINAAFFAAALERGLSAAIMDPESEDVMKTYYACRALHGLDENCEEYIGYMAGRDSVSEAPVMAEETSEQALRRAIIKGLAQQAGPLAERLMEHSEPMDVVQRAVIPALDQVGRGFESGKIYLPQLLMSAEAAKKAFDEVKAAMKIPETGEGSTVVLATVRGDIHDIGKNIVCLLLKSYGFSVRDLGRDVAPEKIVAEVERCRAPLVGLSALMTTTVPAMAETIRRLRAAVPECRIVVGGAVLTEEYAAAIGADRYAKDAMETVRYAEEVCGKQA